MNTYTLRPDPSVKNGFIIYRDGQPVAWVMSWAAANRELKKWRADLYQPLVEAMAEARGGAEVKAGK